MSLLFMEGFDHYDNIAAVKNSSKWASVGGSYPYSVDSGRNGGRGLEASNSNGYAYALLNTTDDTLVFGAALYINSRGSTNYLTSFYYTIQNSLAQNLCYLAMTGTNFQADMFALKNGAETILATFDVPVATWLYIETKIYFHASAGTAIIKVNGVEVVNETGLDTLGGETDAIPYRFALLNSSNSNANTISDDIYVCDTLGSSNNDFLGDVVIKTLVPEADSAVAFTRSAGANNYENIDDTPYADGTTYNYSSTPTDKDLFTFSDLAISPSAIHGVSVEAKARKVTPGLVSVGLHLNTGANLNDLGAYAYIDETFRYVSKLSEYQTGTTPWDASAVNALIAGYEVV